MSIKCRVKYDSVYGIWGKKFLMVEEKFKYNKTIVYINCNMKLEFNMSYFFWMFKKLFFKLNVEIFNFVENKKFLTLIFFKCILKSL